MASDQNGWITYWLDAGGCMEEKLWEDATYNYTQAINILKDSASNIRLHLYNERALSYAYSGNYSKAIQDYSKVIESSKINAEVVTALWGRFYCYGQLGDIIQCDQHYSMLKKVDSRFPQVEIIDDFLLIKTSETWSQDDIKMLANVMRDIGLCDSEKDLKISPTGIFYVRMTNNFMNFLPTKENSESYCCSSRKGNEKSSQEQSIMGIPMKSQSIDSCKENCTTAAYYASLLCGAVAGGKCRAACLLLIEPLRRTCNYCCESGDFYKKCVKPLEKFFPPPCDPMWD